MTSDNEYAWLDAPVDAPIQSQAHLPGFGREAQFDEIMRQAQQLGKDRVWFSDGEFIAFRRKKANPATLERHNRFTANGDYKHIGTSDDVEVYRLNSSSPFKIKPPDRPGGQPKVLDLEQLDWYNIRRQAALAACRRDWKTFRDIVSFMREALNRNVGEDTSSRWTQGFCDTIWAETYQALMQSITMRRGPSAQEINQELNKLRMKSGEGVGRIITIGGGR